MESKRSSFTGKIGFVLAAAGSAVGSAVAVATVCAVVSFLSVLELADNTIKPMTITRATAITAIAILDMWFIGLTLS